MTNASTSLRQAFEEALDAYESWEAGEPEPTIHIQGSDMPISKLCGLLWNCSDTMPARLCTSMGDMASPAEAWRGSGESFARGARLLRYLCRQNAPAPLAA